MERIARRTGLLTDGSKLLTLCKQHSPALFLPTPAKVVKNCQRCPILFNLLSKVDQVSATLGRYWPPMHDTCSIRLLFGNCRVIWDWIRSVCLETNSAGSTWSSSMSSPLPQPSQRVSSDVTIDIFGPTECEPISAHHKHCADYLSVCWRFVPRCRRLRAQQYSCRGRGGINLCLGGQGAQKRSSRGISLLTQEGALD